MKVIDVSEFQGKIDFKKVKADGYEGVIIRAGYGKGNADSYFVRNINGAIKAKMHIGIYWFSYAYTEEMAEKEVHYCHDLISTYKLNIDMPVFFDWEYDSMDYAQKNEVAPDKELITAMTKSFCTEIKNLGYDPGYYANWDYYKNYYEPSKLKKYKLWFADYEDEYKDCYLQQTSSSGEVDGISGAVDTDVLRGKLGVIKEEGDKSSTSEKKPNKKPTNVSYKVGETYTVDVNSALNVRTGAGTKYPLVGYANLTPNAKAHAIGSALLPGTRVTCLDTKSEQNSIWMQIPSGWICAEMNGSVYVK